MGIAHLLTMAMAKEGVSHADAVKRIWMVDSKGLIVKVNVSRVTLYLVSTHASIIIMLSIMWLLRHAWKWWTN